MPPVTPPAIPVGTAMPNFELTDLMSGDRVSSESLSGAPVLVIFLCAHCPYVVHVEAALGSLGDDLTQQGVRVVGIASNDPAGHPEDEPDGLREQAQRNSWSFPYLIDELQSVARDFAAACTPDQYLYDADHKLVYRGRLCGSRPGSEIPVTCEDLRAAVDRMLAGELPAEPVYPSVGCSIKWRP